MIPEVLLREFPGSGFAAASRRGEEWQYEVQGFTKKGGSKITSDSLFDLASLTKVVATLPVCLVLLNRGVLDLNQKINHYVSNAGWFQEPSLGDVEIFKLFNHTSGLPAWKPLFALSNVSSVLKANVLQSNLINPGFRCYSDLGWIVLGHLVERITQSNLDQLADELIFQPLGMKSTGFNPLEQFEQIHCVATEDCGWRKELLQGMVHDENAFALGGVAGHAGLFSNLDDLVFYMDAWLNKLASLGLEKEAEMVMNSKSESEGLPAYGIGWRFPPSLEFSGCGNRSGAMGHTGYTGTSLWFDFQLQEVLILLNNRVYPRRQKTDNAIRSFREMMHEHFLSPV
ncbi:MAG: serine hydrolase [SAR324 cluster bacterium]|jgi:CubicO group peptidase (beta-lactamase class C family)|nr:hypothetical protein [Deltaproteobacteria bacterium]MDP6092829.1 serine hydrolase [SAR324 cluster bacterium]MBP45524.1 hypothetical protein [Deltaproteobacteria bacterium]MDP6248072.1 serine hydrolase [SAR324 cluster bacterium]MDP6465202.1 serine hydrolase [SAR324 cluster bacterium]|tara:strand:- start:3940 stop:4965 length:1026 start_codon:yes stop_codon:yes gene_type:complete